MHRALVAHPPVQLVGLPQSVPPGAHVPMLGRLAAAHRPPRPALSGRGGLRNGGGAAEGGEGAVLSRCCLRGSHTLRDLLRRTCWSMHRPPRMRLLGGRKAGTHSRATTLALGWLMGCRDPQMAVGIEKQPCRARLQAKQPSTSPAVHVPPTLSAGRCRLAFAQCQSLKRRQVAASRLGR